MVELEPNRSRVGLGSTPLTACSVSSIMVACLSQTYIMSFFLLILFIISNLFSYPRFESLPCSHPFSGCHCRPAEASWFILQSGSPQHAPPFHTHLSPPPCSTPNPALPASAPLLKPCLFLECLLSITVVKVLSDCKASWSTQPFLSPLSFEQSGSRWPLAKSTHLCAL